MKYMENEYMKLESVDNEMSDEFTVTRDRL